MDKDNLVLKQALENQDSPDEVFLEKHFLSQLDTNGSSDYSTNQVEFLTTTWSSNGKFLNLREGFVLIPLVFTVENKTKPLKAADDSYNIDLKLKSDNLNIIHSFLCEYNNTSVVQANPEINPYLQFKKNTTSSVTDTKLMGHTGLRDTTQYTWDYDDHFGVNIDEFDKIPSPFHVNDVDKEKLTGPIDSTSGINYVDKSNPNIHYYYYNCFIKLKDLPFLDSMSLSRGGNLRMLFNLNQLEITFKKTVSGLVQATNKKGSSCPFLLSADDVETMLAANNDELSVSCNVAKSLNGVAQHAIKQARLYSPAYTLSASTKKSFELSPQRSLVYNDVYVNHIRRIKPGTFNFQVTNNIVRLKRLIIVPYVSNNTSGQLDGNGTMGFDSLLSPFTEDGLCHPAPCTITDFNVSISGVNIYSTSRKYKFEQYLDELDCAYGSEAGLENGMSTGLFGLEHYENNQGYIVVDLSRKIAPDEKTSVSVEITGDLKGNKNMDFLCYLELEKDIKIDCYSGKILIDNE